ncbi:MAG: immunity 26/phosphotriesterase HocA family protein [Undibacterium sp.]|nr:immunity 26/phosphotriesterase HocA family protein [Undibacterium sp.]
MKTNIKKKKFFEAGYVFAIPLKSGEFTFGLVCEGKDFAFFNYRTKDSNPPNNLQDIPLAFRVDVAKDAPLVGGWEYVDCVELKGNYALPAKYLHKPIGSEQYFIYSAGNEEPATKIDCQNLEILSTWFSFHIEDRLDDFFSGRENKFVIAIKKQLGI